MPPPLEPLFTTRSISPAKRSVTFVTTPFPGSIMTATAGKVAFVATATHTANIKCFLIISPLVTFR